MRPASSRRRAVQQPKAHSSQCSSCASRKVCVSDRSNARPYGNIHTSGCANTDVSSSRSSAWNRRSRSREVSASPSGAVMGGCGRFTGTDCRGRARFPHVRARRPRGCGRVGPPAGYLRTPKGVPVTSERQAVRRGIGVRVDRRDRSAARCADRRLGARDRARESLAPRRGERFLDTDRQGILGAVRRRGGRDVRRRALLRRPAQHALEPPDRGRRRSRGTAPAIGWSAATAASSPSAARTSTEAWARRISISRCSRWR